MDCFRRELTLIMIDKTKIPISFTKITLIAFLLFAVVYNASANEDTSVSPYSASPLSVTVAIPKEFPPYYSLDSNGQPIGFAIETFAHIAKRANLKVTYQIKDSWADVYRSIYDSNADIIPDLGISPERLKHFDFTSSMETSSISIFIRKSSPEINSLKDIKGTRVGVVEGNAIVSEFQMNKNIETLVFNDVESAIFALLSGEIDRAIYPEHVLLNIARSAQVDHLIKVSGDPVLVIKRAVAVLKGRPELYKRLSEAVTWFVGTPEYRQIFSKWHKEESRFFTQERLKSSMFILVFIIMGMLVWRHFSILKFNAKLLTNIEKRKKVEALLSINDQRFRLLFENTNGISVHGYNSKREVIYWNQASETLYGYSANEAMGQQLEDLIIPDQIAGKVIEGINTWIDGGAAIPSSELTLRKSDGTPITVFSNHFLFQNMGKEPELYCVDIDLSELKQAENKEEKSNVILESVFKALPDLFFLLDFDGTIQAFHVHHTSDLYAPPDAFLGKKMQEIMPKYIADQFDENRLKVNRDGGTITYTYTLDLPGKGAGYYEARICQLPESTEIVAVVRNITDKILLEEKEQKLIKAAQFADAANKAKSQFLANMSHELRTPMHGILSYSNMGVSRIDTATKEQTLKYFSRIKTSGDRLLALLNDLLDLSKLEAGKMRMEHSDNILKSVVNSCVDEQSARMADQKISAVWNENTITGEGCFDPVRIGQVITNLLSNAIKFSSPEQTIELNIQTTQLEHAKEEPSEAIKFTIRDHGVGIPEEDLMFIFNQFEQSTISPVSGTGLGLPISKEIIAQHHGEIWAENHIDGGAVFTFTIPRNNS